MHLAGKWLTGDDDLDLQPFAQPVQIMLLDCGKHLQLAQVDQRQQWRTLAHLLARLQVP
ncbi:hypothetical protein D3C80_2154300 [compost metagenome]